MSDDRIRTVWPSPEKQPPTHKPHRWQHKEGNWTATGDWQQKENNKIVTYHKPKKSSTGEPDLNDCLVTW